MSCPTGKIISRTGRLIGWSGRVDDKRYLSNLKCRLVRRSRCHSVIQVIRNRISVFRPCSRIITISDRAGGDGHRGRRSRQVSTRPPCKGIPRAGRVVQCDGRSRYLIRGRVRRRDCPSGECIRYIIGDNVPLSNVCQISRHSVGRRGDIERCRLICQPMSVPAGKRIPSISRCYRHIVQRQLRHIIPCPYRGD